MSEIFRRNVVSPKPPFLSRKLYQNVILSVSFRFIGDKCSAQGGVGRGEGLGCSDVVHRLTKELDLPS